MKRTAGLMLAVVVGAGLTLTGCGSDGGGGGGDQAAAGKVGVILPDTKSSVRWETKDRPALEEAFKAAGVEYTIQNAEGSADTMATIADGADDTPPGNVRGTAADLKELRALLLAELIGERTENPDDSTY